MVKSTIGVLSLTKIQFFSIIKKDAKNITITKINNLNLQKIYVSVKEFILEFSLIFRHQNKTCTRKKCQN